MIGNNSEQQTRVGRLPRGPYLSHSRINRYLHCPEQYRLYYVEGLRPKTPAASLVFGQVLHQVLARHFKTGDDPGAVFEERWHELQSEELRYSSRESWERLRDQGRQLLTTFLAEERPRLTKVTSVEESFTLMVTSLETPFVGIVDLVADLDSKQTVVDFKTSAGGYDAHQVALSDQLTAYALARPEAEQVALCVLVKSASPRIEWHTAKRRPEDVLDYLRKVVLVGDGIQRGHFYRRPGWWCGMCDYLPVCLGDEQKVRATLVRKPAAT